MSGISMVTAVLYFHQSVMEDQKVQTCDFYRTDPNLPHRFNNPDCFHGYGSKKSNPMYRTTNQMYGSRKPSVHEMPTEFHGLSCRFSEVMLRSGMYQNGGFNTALDTSRVTDPMATYHKKVQHQHLCHHGNQSSNHHESKN